MNKFLILLLIPFFGHAYAGSKSEFVLDDAGIDQLFENSRDITSVLGNTEFKSALTETGCIQSRMRGVADVDASISWSWAGIGFGAGFCTVGSAIFITPLIAVILDNVPADIPADVNPACYLAGYEAKKKKVNALSALGGGCAGALTFLGMYYLAAFYLIAASQ